MVRFPGATHRVARWIFRLPRSDLRRRVLRHFAGRAWAAFNRRDWEVNTVLFDAERYEFRPGDAKSFIPGSREAYRGVDGYLEAMELWLGEWSGMRVYLEDVTEVGPGRMIHVVRFVGEGRASGVTIEQLNAAVLDVRDGRVVKHVTWWDVAGGFRSVGLAPPGRSK